MAYLLKQARDAEASLISQLFQDLAVFASDVPEINQSSGLPNFSEGRGTRHCHAVVSHMTELLAELGESAKTKDAILVAIRSNPRLKEAVILYQSFMYVLKKAFKNPSQPLLTGVTKGAAAPAPSRSLRQRPQRSDGKANSHDISNAPDDFLLRGGGGGGGECGEPEPEAQPGSSRYSASSSSSSSRSSKTKAKAAPRPLRDEDDDDLQRAIALSQNGKRGSWRSPLRPPSPPRCSLPSLSLLTD